jgi:protein-disulfide isomerase
LQQDISINSIKADEAVFRAILKKQPAIETNKADSIILFGNPDAKLWISILTNPFCNPCALMHKRVEKLLDNPAIETEFQKHAAWKEKSRLRATPTILVNGYQLPENYKIEDLRYFTEFTIDVK